MRMDKLTSRFQQALADAQSLAVGRDNTIIEPAHLLLALLDQQGGGAPRCWRRPGSTCRCARTPGRGAGQAAQRSAARPATCRSATTSRACSTSPTKLAQQRGDGYIASELFLLAALEDSGETGRALKAAGADKAKLEAAIDKLRGRREGAGRERGRRAPGAGEIHHRPHRARGAASSATRRSAAASRCCNAGPRTTRC